MNYHNQPQSKSNWFVKIFNALAIVIGIICINVLSENPAITINFARPILELNFDTN